MNTNPKSHLLKRLVITVLLVLSLCQSVVHADDHASFQDVVNQNFRRWAQGKLYLTPQRVNELVRYHSLQGDEAAAVAAIHWYQSKVGKKSKSVTRNFLLGGKSDKSSSFRSKMRRNYRRFAEHIDSVPRYPFTDRRPNLNSIAQGNLGDCYFVAPLGAYTRYRSSRIGQMIRQNRDGSYDVRFPSGKHVTVPALTDSQIALSSNAKQQGVWLNVLEYAAGIVLKNQKHQTHISALDQVGSGGDPAFSIQLLTGHKSNTYKIRRKVKGKYIAPRNSEVPKLAARFHNLISNGLGHHRVICASAGVYTVPPGMTSEHAYAVTGMKDGYVQVWNPHGFNCDFEPKGTPGLKNGYHYENGRAWIPMRDFVRIFYKVNIESGTRLQSGNHHASTRRPSRTRYRTVTRRVSAFSIPSSIHTIAANFNSPLMTNV